MKLLAVVTPPSIYQYRSNLFCQAQICTNDYFSPNSFSKKGDYLLFPYSLVS